MKLIVLGSLALALVARAENLAPLAQPSTSFVSGHETLEAINDGFEPKGINDHSHGCYGNWPKTGKQWVQLEWRQPISTKQIEVYWWDDNRGVRLPVSCQLSYWDGKKYVPVRDAIGLGVEGKKFNTTTFAEVTTPKLRLEMTAREKFSTGIIEWRVLDSGKSPKFPPRISAGPDRIVVLPGLAHLCGAVKGVGFATTWSKVAGPGEVAFADAHAPVTTATFTKPGAYTLQLTAKDGALAAQAETKVSVEAPPSAAPLEMIEPMPYTLTSPFWRARIKGQIVHWIPHCIRKLDEPNLKEGGIQNFVEAAHKLAGQPGKHLGPPWANAYVHNTIESICLALMVDAQGEAEILAAQNAMRKKLDEWIPKVLAAQEPDGYLHTAYTTSGHKRWSRKGDHEGYTAAYFIEAALAHMALTGGKDTRLFDAAKKLADCWDAHLGPAPKQTWYDGHEALEQALVRLAWFVDRHEGAGKGQKYLALSKFLLDCRRNGEEYDQSHLPVIEQAEAVGHAVRASYLFAGIAAVGLSTGDAAYLGAARSLWNNTVNRKWYVTGGIGSGETSEGFGKDFSLGQGAYCESCSSCGLVMFQHKMQMAWQDARYADLLEDTLFNALLGSVDLDGQNFTYTNPLDSSAARYKWHGCPCCVGNIPRTLLMLPTWMYTRSSDSLYVNLYAGSRVKLDDLEIVQTTDYPWNGKVTLAMNPAAPRKLTLKLRVPNRNVSELYMATPKVDFTLRVTVKSADGHHAERDDYKTENGYVVITRTWQAGDKVEFEVPLAIQRVKADERIVATRGKVALRYGPLVYNLESKDQNVESILDPAAPLTTEWKPDLLGGVMVIKGAFADGQPLLAIPNYARLNRGGRSLVWIKAQK
jgi:DUF1680 family protein